jgi:hypothetical protein
MRKPPSRRDLSPPLAQAIRVCASGITFFTSNLRCVYLNSVYSHTLFSSFTGPVSDTIPAHRLMTKAYEIGGPAAQTALITPLFRAYYEDDLDISDADVLADAAEQAGIMSKDEVSFLMHRNGGPEILRLRGDPPCKLVRKSDAEY